MTQSYIGLPSNHIMVTFHTARKINAPVSEVWKILSDVDREPEFWYGTKSIRNLSKTEKVVEREVVIAFRNSTCKETVTFEPMKSITTDITGGPLKGKKVVLLNPDGEDASTVNVEWDIKLSGFMGVFSKMVQKHILDGTNQALERISRVIEK
ncbi:MAG TPA: SRPBCC family protein [Nitrososphaeraceae archaeon]|nr:SRPBCC family protein [Nitrososphaeraceae archaeon]